MTKYINKFNATYTTKQLFNLVIDIENYPLFIPWCVGARIHEKNYDSIIAELLIEFENFSEKYTSLVRFNYPTDIHVTQMTGPFRKLANRWQFIEISHQNTEIVFEIEFEFKTRILDALMTSVIKKATTKISQSFIDRANQIYNN